MVNLLPWLITFRAAVKHLDKKIAQKALVDGLVQADKLYHFNDSAHDIEHVRTSEKTFSVEEAVILDELRDILYDEELLGLALEACQ